MTTTAECTTRHKHINWLIGVLFTIMFGLITVSSTITINLLSAQNAAAAQVSKLDKDIDNLTVSIKYNEKVYNDILNRLAKLDRDVDNIKTSLISVEKKIDIHISREKDGK
jgi:tetrahydromethanopterin S-methyltransferase subunit G